jgi:hypothetical protein
VLHTNRNFEDANYKLWTLKEGLSWNTLWDNLVTGNLKKCRELSPAGIREIQQKWKSERF